MAGAQEAFVAAHQNSLRLGCPAMSRTLGGGRRRGGPGGQEPAGRGERKALPLLADEELVDSLLFSHPLSDRVLSQVCPLSSALVQATTAEG